MISRPVEVRFGGQGGQGLVTLGAVLAEAGARCGLYVAASQTYGSAARGGETCADVILSAEPIDFPHVVRPGWLVTFAQEAYDRYAPMVQDGGTILFDSFFVHSCDRSAMHQYAVPSTATAIEKTGSQVAANFIMLGGLIGISDLAGIDEVAASINTLVSERFRSLNFRAFAIGLEMVKQIRQTPGAP
jgi:Pyruvate:ferredoxin oxidoreductase and related 2-oxoacid:ferredoxin oxidoreductases, gamma subunit